MARAARQLQGGPVGRLRPAWPLYYGHLTSCTCVICFSITKKYGLVRISSYICVLLIWGLGSPGSLTLCEYSVYIVHDVNVHEKARSPSGFRKPPVAAASRRPARADGGPRSASMALQTSAPGELRGRATTMFGSCCLNRMCGVGPRRENRLVARAAVCWYRVIFGCGVTFGVLGAMFCTHVSASVC